MKKISLILTLIFLFLLTGCDIESVILDDTNSIDNKIDINETTESNACYKVSDSNLIFSSVVISTDESIIDNKIPPPTL